MTSKEKLMELLKLKEEDFNLIKTTENDRIEALEMAMLEIILGG